MKPLHLAIGAAAATCILVGVVNQSANRKVTLPVYDAPVTFFSEEEQGIRLADLPHGVKSLSARECAGCHEKEHSEWLGSAHSRSVTEPVFTAAFKSEPRALCRSCHSPLLEQHPILISSLKRKPTVLITGFEMLPTSQHERAHIKEPNPDYNESLMREGVTCVTCHVRDGTVLTSNPTAAAGVPHALSYSPLMRKADFCGGCHQFDIQNPQVHPFEKVPEQVARIERLVRQRERQRMVRGSARARVQMAAQQGVPDQPEKKLDSAAPDDPPVPPQPGLEQQYQHEARVQHTLDEFRVSPAALRGETCQSCHMPADRNRPRHTWPGRDSLAMLRKAVTMTARLDRETYRQGDKLQAVIKIKNDAGHKFPTGDSIHAGIVDVWLRDGEKSLARRVFVMSNQNASGFFLTKDGTFPIGGGMESPFNRRETSTAAQARLEAPVRADTRLLPGEEAMLVYTQPVGKELARARSLRLQIRVFHAAVHPGFKGSSIDPGLRTLRLIREESLPVLIGPIATAVTPVRKSPAS